jgi:hypothetical protein
MKCQAQLKNKTKLLRLYSLLRFIPPAGNVAGRGEMRLNSSAVGKAGML